MGSINMGQTDPYALVGLPEVTPLHLIDDQSRPYKFYPQLNIYKTLKHTQTGELLDEHWQTIQMQKLFLQSLQHRREHPMLLVQAKYCYFPSKIDDKCFCNSKQFKMKLFLEYIPVRLSDFEDIPYPESVYVMHQCLHGYKVLYERHGPFEVSEAQICVNVEGQVKIWSSIMLSEIIPDGQMVNNEAMQDSGGLSEQLMLHSVIDIVSNNLEQEQHADYQQFIHHTLRRCSSFSEATCSHNDFVQNNQINMPSFINSLKQSYSHLEPNDENKEQKPVSEVENHRHTEPSFKQLIQQADRRYSHNQLQGASMNSNNDNAPPNYMPQNNMILSQRAVIPNELVNRNGLILTPYGRTNNIPENEQINYLMNGIPHKQPQVAANLQAYQSGLSFRNFQNATHQRNLNNQFQHRPIPARNLPHDQHSAQKVYRPVNEPHYQNYTVESYQLPLRAPVGSMPAFRPQNQFGVSHQQLGSSIVYPFQDSPENEERMDQQRVIAQANERQHSLSGIGNYIETQGPYYRPHQPQHNPLNSPHYLSVIGRDQMGMPIKQNQQPSYTNYSKQRSDLVRGSPQNLQSNSNIVEHQHASVPHYEADHRQQYQGSYGDRRTNIIDNGHKGNRPPQRTIQGGLQQVKARGPQYKAVGTEYSHNNIVRDTHTQNGFTHAKNHVEQCHQGRQQRVNHTTSQLIRYNGNGNMPVTHQYAISQFQGPKMKDQSIRATSFTGAPSITGFPSITGGPSITGISGESMQSYGHQISFNGELGEQRSHVRISNGLNTLPPSHFGQLKFHSATEEMKLDSQLLQDLLPYL